ncbi:MAG TPA: trypsin-like peptidase domain-containing protein, partial [Anaerolineae bacterium]
MSRSRILLLVMVLALLAGAVATSGVPSAVLATPLAHTGPIQAVSYPYPAPAKASPTPAALSNPAPQPASAPAAETHPAPAAANAITINIEPGADAESQILEAVYEKVNPAVVKVVNLAQSGGRRGLSLGVLPQGEGSGFLWDHQGHIITNDHVISGADKLQVILSDGTEADATLVGTDPGSDVAVVQVDAGLVTNVAPVEQADLSGLKVGAMAIAIGNPFGFQNTMTRGIVSALGRSIPSQTQYNIPEAIQTDAAINPGNSGGPLLNDQGQVIGINDQIESQSGSFSGVGFAIPIDLVQRIVPALIKNGEYRHAYLGITGDTFSRSWAEALGLPATGKGVYIMDTTGTGPADKAG